MRNIHCLNNISAYGTDLLTDDYQLVDDLTQAEASRPLPARAPA